MNEWISVVQESSSDTDPWTIVCDSSLTTQRILETSLIGWHEISAGKMLSGM